MEFDEKDLQEVRESRLLIDRYDDWLFDEFRPFVGQRVLEIGCGLGNHFEHLLDRELLVGFDVSEQAVKEVRRRYAGRPNVRAECLDITDRAVLTLKQYRFDTAISINVLEHIEQDSLALKYAYQLLEGQGTLIVVVPAHHWLYGPMDSAIGHFRRYTKATLASGMRIAGFEILLAKYLNMLGAVGWLVNGRLLRRRVPPRGQLRLLNRLVPFVRCVERIIPAPFGISLLMIARKSSG